MSKAPICPLLGKKCVGHDCMFWVNVQGKDPQTGVDKDLFDCSFRWLPRVILETARQTRGVQASVESMRNEVVQRQDQLNTVVALGQREAAKRIGDQECQQIEHLPKTT